MPYSDLDKAMAVEIVNRNGGRLDATTIAEVRQILNAPTLSGSTMHGWLKRAARPPIRPDSPPDSGSRIIKKGDAPEAPSTVQGVAAQTLDVIMEQVAHEYLRHARKPEIIGASGGFEAIKAAATAIDKMRLLRGLPTEIIAVLPALVNALEGNGIDATEFFKMALAKARATRVNNADH